MELSAWDSEGQREGKPLCDAPCPVYGIVSLRASELEAGPEHDECGGGGWGDGAGKWWVKVEDAAPRSDPLIAMSLLYAPNVGVVTNMSCPALTYLGETDDSLVTTGALAPVNAAAFWALAEGQKMVLWLESGEWAELRLTQFSTSIYLVYPRKLTMRLPSDSYEGTWSEVLVRLGSVASGAQPKVSIYTDSSGDPGSSLYVLSNPSPVASDNDFGRNRTANRSSPH